VRWCAGLWFMLCVVAAKGIGPSALVPFMLTNRSDTVKARIVLAALAKKFYHWRRQRLLG
jgi:phosphate acetyltransferase